MLGALRVDDVELRDEQPFVITDGRLDGVGLRPVAATLWPASSAAWAKSTSMPRPAPVTNQDLVSVEVMGQHESTDQKAVRGPVKVTLPGSPTPHRAGLR